MKRPDLSTGIPAAAKLGSETGLTVQHKKRGPGTVGLPVSTKWAVHFENGEVHTYTKAQLSSKFGVSKITPGASVQHKTRGTGTVGADKTGKVYYSLEKFLAVCKKKRSRFVMFRQKIR